MPLYAGPEIARRACQSAQIYQRAWNNKGVGDAIALGPGNIGKAFEQDLNVTQLSRPVPGQRQLLGRSVALRIVPVQRHHLEKGKPRQVQIRRDPA